MKFLFISNSLPFPARNGVELPIENLARHFSKRHEVDFLVVGSSDAARRAFADRLSNVPTELRSIFFLQVLGQRALASFVSEISGRRPMFAIHGTFAPRDLAPVLGKSYDFIWVSPIGCLGLVEMLAQKGKPLKGRVVVGLNDATYGNYANGWRYLLRHFNPREWRRMLNALRTPWLFFLERKLLLNAFAVHVQTPLERQRVERLFRLVKKPPAIICKQNGSSKTSSGTRLAQPKGKVILFMTHLSGRRREESRWFLQKVWPLIQTDHPDAELWLVGSPPDDDAPARQIPPGVRILGFVRDLDQVLRQACLGVVPTLHSSGWINRVADYLRAGLPVVASPEPLGTIPGLVPGIHAESAKTPREFARKVNALLTDPEKSTQMSREAQVLASQFPDWSETACYIEERLTALVDEYEY